MKTFRGSFCWYGEMHYLFTTCKSEHVAKRNLLTQLAKKLKRTRASISVYFLGSNRYSIEEAPPNGKNAD
jgi:hypothetical protein